MNTQKEVEYIAEIARLKSALGMLNGEIEPTLDVVNNLIAEHFKSNKDCRYRVTNSASFRHQDIHSGKAETIHLPPTITATKEVEVL